MADLDLSTFTDEQLASMGREMRQASRDPEHEAWVKHFFAAVTLTINAELGSRTTRQRGPFG